MSYRNPDELDDELQGLFSRATAQVRPRPDLAESVERRLASGGPGRPGGLPRGPMIAATLSAFLVVALLVGALYALANRGGTNVGGRHNTTQRTATTPFSVSSVALSVSPSSIASATCGTAQTFTYTAVFTIPANTAGGTIQFNYTLNNGRSQTPATVTVAAGATSASYTFTSAGALPADHTYPGPAQVMVTSPGSVLSNSALPSGSCVAPAPTGAFTVDSVDMAVSPSSLAGVACGTNETVTYTATIHLPANGPGGTIQFYWTDNNGRGDNPASINVAPGQTFATYQFTWSGALPPDHTAPEGGGVMVRSPNSVNSQLIGPSGQCG